MNKLKSRFTSIFHSLCMGKYFRNRNRSLVIANCDYNVSA